VWKNWIRFCSTLFLASSAARFRGHDRVAVDGQQSAIDQRDGRNAHDFVLPASKTRDQIRIRRWSREIDRPGMRGDQTALERTDVFCEFELLTLADEPRHADRHERKERVEEKKLRAGQIERIHRIVSDF
jgi:hypothetical protein